MAFFLYAILALTGSGLVMAGLTGVAEVNELFGQEVGEQLHDEQQVLVLVLLGRGVAALAALVVLGVDLQQRQARLVQLHGLGLVEGRGGEGQEVPVLLRRGSET